MGSFATEQFTATYNLYAVALSWMQALGVRFPATRLQRYERLLRQFAAASPDAQRALIAKAPSVFYSWNLEVDEIISAFRSLAGRYDVAVARNSDHISHGPDCYTNEQVRNSSNRSRNAMFELSVMARLARADLPMDPLSQSDISAQFAGRHFFIECKRPQSFGKLSACASDAISQLQVHYERRSRPRQRGLVAIDATKLLHPAFIPRNYESKQALEHEFNAASLRALARTRDAIRWPRDWRTCGLLLRVREVALIANETGFAPYVCTFFGLACRPGLSRREESVVEQMRDALNGGVAPP